jgi:hypothetical protein
VNTKAIMLLGVALIAVLLTSTATPTRESEGFVRRSGTQLRLDGAQFRMIGWNMHLPNCITPSSYRRGTHSAYTLAELKSQLAEVKANSNATVVRAWLLQEYGGPNNWSGFDNLIAAANANHIKIVAVLGNNWGACEPKVHGTLNEHHLAWYQSGYKMAGDGYPLSFRDYAAAVAAHYANQTAIAEWQIMNEPDARNANGSCDESSAESALRYFADDMTGVIKAVDPNHLVDLGEIAWCGGQGTGRAYVNSGAVDVCDAVHDYSNPSVPMSSTYASYISMCTRLGKPALVGEAGIDGDVGPNGTDTGTVTAATLRQRATFLDARINAYINAGAAGFIYWDKKGNGLPAPGHPQVGSPDPSEAVIAKYAASASGAR